MSQVDEKGGGGPPDILSQPAMHNAYFICHNVQVLIDTFFKAFSKEALAGMLPKLP